MPTTSFDLTKSSLETYFDRTAVEAWTQLTSNAPVSRVRATVRAGRDRMRSTLAARLPADLSGRRVLDAGCGAGQMAVELARRGAEVVAIDISPRLVGVARQRASDDVMARIDFRVGDMLDPALGRFDHVLAMDSLIHYSVEDVVGALSALGERTSGSLVFTVAPRTPALTLMHAAGKLFPRADRSPAIRPIGHRKLARHLAMTPPLRSWRMSAPERIVSGFYISEAMELSRP